MFNEKYTPEKIANLEKSRAISDAELLKNGAHYEIDKETEEKRLVPTDEQVEKIYQYVEEGLAKGILTPENLQNGSLEINFGSDDFIEYEFELEQEQRIKVDPENFEIKEWQNHVVDIYDQSGRCRIRNKNDKSRLSLKVPLFSQDTDRAKCCIRLEFKPGTKKQTDDLLKIQELITKEPETQVHEKWGTKISLTNGDKVWINKDAEGNHWIETDDATKIEKFLPDGITYLGHAKSNIKTERGAEIGHLGNKETIRRIILENIKATSRSANGVLDTSASLEKQMAMKDVNTENLEAETMENADKFIEYVLVNKERKFEKSEDIKDLIKAIYDIFQRNQQGGGEFVLRRGKTSYAGPVSAERIPEKMENFYENLLEKIHEADRKELNPAALARWIEWEIDHNIHPFADGCGRIAKAVSAFVLVRNNSPLPYHRSREEYYAAMNKSEDSFREYYVQAIQRSIKDIYRR